MTKKMQEFIKKNSEQGIVYGDLRTSNNKVVHTKSDTDDVDRTFYRFADGTSLTLHAKDKATANPGYSPAWEGMS